MKWDTLEPNNDYDTVNGVHLPPDTITILPSPKLCEPLKLRQVKWTDRPSDIEQGRGDGCSLAAATIAIQDHVKRYGPTAVKCSSLLDGTSVVLHWFINGAWRSIRINDICYGIFNGNNRLDCSSNGASCWATAAERIHRIIGQTPEDNLDTLLSQQSNPAAIMHHLTGWPAESILCSHVAPDVFDNLTEGRCIVCIGTSPDVPKSSPLLSNHAYAVTGCFRQSDKIWMLLRNPWSDACCRIENIPCTLWIETGNEFIKYLHIAWNLTADDELILRPGDSHRHKVRPLGVGTVKVFLIRHYTNRRQLLNQYISMKLGSTSTTYTSAECFSVSTDAPQIDCEFDLVVRGYPQRQPLQRYCVRIINGKLVQT